MQKTKLVLLQLLTLLNLSYCAQSKVDSLIEQLNSAHSESSIQAVTDQINDEITSDPAQLKSLANALEVSAKKVDYKKGIGMAYLYRGIANKSSDGVDAAMKNLEKAKEIFGKISFAKGEAMAWLNMGNLFQMQGDLEKALECQQNALVIKEKMGDDFGVATSSMSIGNLYDANEQYEKANEFYKKSLQIGQDLNHKLFVAYCYHNIGSNYRTLQEYDSSFYYLNKALEYGENFPDHIIHANTHLSLGILYYDLGQLDKAIVAQTKAYQMAVELGNARIEGITLFNLAEYYFLQEKYKLALDKVTQAQEIYQRLGMVHDDMKCFLMYKRIYQGMGRHEKALGYMDTYLQIKDSLFGIEKEKEILALLAKFEAAKRESEIAVQEIEIKELSLQKKEAVYRRNLILVVSTFLLILIITMYFRQKSINKRNKEIHLSKQKIKQMELDNTRNEFENYRVQLNQFTNDLLSKYKMVEKMRQNFDRYKKDEYTMEAHKQHFFEELSDIKILTKEDWITFKKLFKEVYDVFYSNFIAEFPNLTEGEIRLCMLIKLEFSSPQIADVIGISPDSVKKSRQRLRKKLSLDEDKGLSPFIIDFKKPKA